MKKKLLNFAIALSLGLILFSCSKKEEIGRTEPGNVTYSPELATLQSGVVVEKKGDNYLWEGDILLPPKQLKALNDSGTIFVGVPENPELVTSINPVTNLPDLLCKQNYRQNMNDTIVIAVINSDPNTISITIHSL